MVTGIDVLTLGTRKSKLALAQTSLVRTALLAAHAGLTVDVEHITTKGDIILDRPLSAIGDKGLFIVEIEEAMRSGRVDAAVHSAKDLPATLPPDMALVAFPRRADARDALLSRSGLGLRRLPAGALVGTSSLRRACQLRAVRPDLRLEDLRGNVDTRLRKLQEGQYDAIILAAAGLVRLGLAGEITEYLEPDLMVPAVGQGVMAIEARSADAEIAELFASLDDQTTRATITAERAFLARIGGGCQVPVGAYATIENRTLHLIGMIGARDGRQVRGELRAAVGDPHQLGSELADELLGCGGRELLALR